MDGNGQNVQYIGDFSGSPVISPDGKRIAVGCASDYHLGERDFRIPEICLLDIEIGAEDTLKILGEDYSEDFMMDFFEDVPQSFPRLFLPEQCLEYFVSNTPGDEGVVSMTWSPEADTLAVVCRDDMGSEVCILPIEGEARCWDQAAAEDVIRTDWSPVDENILVISGGWPEDSEIFITDPEGTNKRFLTAGFSPVWSPDGRKIAYAEKIPESEEDAPLYGIAVIKPDGSAHEWLYRPDPDKPETWIYLDQNGSEGQIEANRLAWSPDGRYLVFTGLCYGAEGSRLFRLDIKTGEIIILLAPAIFENWVSEVDWGL